MKPCRQKPVISYLTAFQTVSTPVAYIITYTPFTKSVAWPHLLLCILWNSWLFVWLMIRTYSVIPILLQQVLLQRAWGLVKIPGLYLSTGNSNFNFYFYEFSLFISGNILCSKTISALSYSVFACNIYFLILLLSPIIIKLYLWILKFEFHINFHLSNNIFFFWCFRTLYNVNTIPSSWTLQNQAVGEFTLWGIISLNPYNIIQNKVSPI